MSEFLTEVQRAIKSRNFTKAEEITEELRTYVEATGSLSYSMVLLDTANFLADKPPFAMTTLKSAVTVHQAIGEPQWEEEARAVWRKAFENLPAPNLHTKLKRGDKVDGFLYTMEHTDAAGGSDPKADAEKVLHDLAARKWDDYADTLSPQLQSKYAELMRTRPEEDAQQPRPESHVDGISPETLAQAIPELSLDEVRQFRRELAHISQNLPKGLF